MDDAVLGAFCAFVFNYHVTSYLECCRLVQCFFVAEVVATSVESFVQFRPFAIFATFSKAQRRS